MKHPQTHPRFVTLRMSVSEPLSPEETEGYDNVVIRESLLNDANNENSFTLDFDTGDFDVLADFWRS